MSYVSMYLSFPLALIYWSSVNQLEFEAQLASHVSHIRVKKMNKGCKHNTLSARHMSMCVAEVCWYQNQVYIRLTRLFVLLQGLCWIEYPEETNYVVYVPLTRVTIRHPPLMSCFRYSYNAETRIHPGTADPLKKKKSSRKRLSYKKLRNAVLPCMKS